VKALLVGLGGFVGSIGRYGIAVWMDRLWPTAVLPYATLTVNAAGSFLIGLLAAASSARGWLTPELRALVLIGVLGGFTTFSTFAYETIALGRQGAAARAVLNVILNVGGCLLAAWAGMVIGRLFVTAG
jgi:CrcB protein